MAEDKRPKNGSSGGSDSKDSGSGIDDLGPYYINPNENLAQGIISVKLNPSNYHLWSRTMRIALKTKRKIGFIGGSLLMPESTDPNFDIWDRSNTSVEGWIINSLEPDISESMIDNDNAYELWKDLKEKYGEADSVSIA
ncbi:hypothetical protein LINPERPRIM_LOCUS23590 [Linum perenne]